MKQQHKKSKVVSFNKWGYIFLIPFVVVYLVFSFVPLVSTIYYSFFEKYRVGVIEVGPNWIWFDNYKKEIANTFKALSNQSWGEARNYAIRMQGEIVNDPELIARVRTSKEYQAQLKSIQERKDMSNEEKVKWILNHPYRFIPILNNEGRIVGGKLGTNQNKKLLLMKRKRD